MEKPIDFKSLADKIQLGINKNSDGHLKGIMLFSFLQLLQIEKKTCVLKITSGVKKGLLYFSKGDLIDAGYEELTGEAAAFEIVCWEEVEIEIIKVFKKHQRHIRKQLQNILMEAAQKKDEEVFGAVSSKKSGKIRDSNDDSVKYFSAEIPGTHSLRKEITEKKRNLSAQAEKTKNVIIEKRSFDNNKHKKENNNTMANNINQSLDELMAIEGAKAVALVDCNSGMALGVAGGGMNLEVAAAGNTEVVKSKQKVMESLGLKDKIEDILISLGGQYHLIRPLTTHPNLFFYVVLNRANSNLAMARFKLSDVEGRVEV